VGSFKFWQGHHVTSILMKEKLKLPVRLINFPGAVENENALIRGDIDVAMVAEEGAKPLVDAGKLESYSSSENQPRSILVPRHWVRWARPNWWPLIA